MLLFFVADVHALTEATKSSNVYERSIEVAKTYIACGLEPSDNCVLYFQSQIDELHYIASLIATCFKTGRLQICNTFKDRLRKISQDAGEVPASMLIYPIWMAADIIGVRADLVPVGEDQLQHIEMTREAVRRFNHQFSNSNILKIPNANLTHPCRVPGIDGSKKMGKSDANTISLLDDPRTVLRKVERIPTQSTIGGEFAEGTTALFRFVELCCPLEVHADYMERFQSGDAKIFGEMKKRLASDIVAMIEPIRLRYQTIADEELLHAVESGARQVREIAREVLDEMKWAIGLKGPK